HFFAYAPEPMKYPIDRFTMETKRQLDLLNKTLGKRPYIAGDEYTIADIVNWSWYGRLALGDLYEGSAEFLDIQSYPKVLEWARRIAERPAVKKGLEDRKSTRLNSSHVSISYAVFCLKKKKKRDTAADSWLDRIHML